VGDGRQHRRAAVAARRADRRPLGRPRPDAAEDDLLHDRHRRARALGAADRARRAARHEAAAVQLAGGAGRGGARLLQRARPQAAQHPRTARRVDRADPAGRARRAAGAGLARVARVRRQLHDLQARLPRPAGHAAHGAAAAGLDRRHGPDRGPRRSAAGRLAAGRPLDVRGAGVADQGTGRAGAAGLRADRRPPRRRPRRVAPPRGVVGDRGQRRAVRAVAGARLPGVARARRAAAVVRGVLRPGDRSRQQGDRGRTHRAAAPGRAHADVLPGPVRAVVAAGDRGARGAVAHAAPRRGGRPDGAASLAGGRGPVG
jgi:hypothetical protein